MVYWYLIGPTKRFMLAGEGGRGGRQKAEDRRQKRRKRDLRLNFGYLARIQALQKVHRLLLVEPRIRRFHEQEEPVTARVIDEALDIEDRVVRHRQPVEDDHRDDRRYRCEQNRQLEGDGNELGPAVERLACDVGRIGNHMHPVLEPVPRQQARKSAQEDDERETAIVMADRFPRFLDRKG